MYTDFEYCLVFCPEYHSTSRINFTVNVSLVILLPLFSGVFGPHFWPTYLAVITHLKLITWAVYWPLFKMVPQCVLSLDHCIDPR